MLSFEICYTIVKKMLEEDGEMITRTELLFLMTEMMKKYDEIGMDKMEEDVREFLGEEVFARYNELSLKRKDYIIEFCKKESEETLYFFERLSISPRYTLSIASFTTKYDNRNMWENYADNYTGFCVEYDFSKAKEFLAGEDVLHILPVEYYEERPRFDMESLVNEYIRMKVANQLNKDWVEDFMCQYYLAILSKQIDYRAEEEWRYIGKLEQRGEHFFPFVNAIYIGKNMKENNRKIIQDVARELDVPVYIQEVDFKNASFKYNLLDNPL